MWINGWSGCWKWDMKAWKSCFVVYLCWASSIKKASESQLSWEERRKRGAFLSWSRACWDVIISFNEFFRQIFNVYEDSLLCSFESRPQNGLQKRSIISLEQIKSLCIKSSFSSFLPSHRNELACYVRLWNSFSYITENENENYVPKQHTQQ